MTDSEKKTLVNFYMNWGPGGFGFTKHRRTIDKAYPATRHNIERLISLGMLQVEVSHVWEDHEVSITPRGVSVAEMLLG